MRENESQHAGRCDRKGADGLHRFAAHRHVGPEHQHRRPDDHADCAILKPAHSWHAGFVVEARHQLAVHLDPAFDAFD